MSLIFCNFCFIVTKKLYGQGKNMGGGTMLPRTVFRNSECLWKWTHLKSRKPNFNWVNSTPIVFVGGPELKYEPRNRLSFLRFLVIFLSHSRQMPRLSFNCFLSLPFEFKSYYCLIPYKSWDTCICIVAGYQLDSRASIPSKGKRFFCSPQRPDRIWVPSCPIGIEGSFLSIEVAGA
jgi:hypothetical protein